MQTHSLELERKGNCLPCHGNTLAHCGRSDVQHGKTDRLQYTFWQSGMSVIACIQLDYRMENRVTAKVQTVVTLVLVIPSIVYFLRTVNLLSLFRYMHAGLDKCSILTD